MLNKIDSFLNRTTMYKVVLYYLIALWLVAFLFSILGILNYTPVSMVFSLVILLSVAWATNIIFARIFKVPANVESIYISVFILALIITPALVPSEYIFLGWVALLAMASKYIFAINHKHIFNPVAFSVALTAFTINGTASWWVGTFTMLPFILAGGLLLIRKIKRIDLTFSFFVAGLISILFFVILKGGDIFATLSRVLLYSPFFFFTFVMITEPLTTPPSRFLRILYGIFVGLLFAPQIHIGSFYFTPELALLFGNVFSYLISPKKRLTLKLKKIVKLTPDTGEFVFEPDRPMHFRPGQYLEWTLGHNKIDSRGNRRYFTIASSPTEKELLLGVKFYENPSSFKKGLFDMKMGDTIIASQLSGDFVMPRNKKKKLVFVAGGIGITPFRSMIKYLIDTGEKRDIVLIYANKTEADIVYKNILNEGIKSFNLKIVYLISDKTTNWTGRTGYVNEQMIKEEILDFRERNFYVSGPHVMVASTEKILKNLGISNNQIKTDFFPGFA